MSAMRILVVDDEADIRGLLTEILSEEGYSVEVAADAEQARDARARQPPDLVLLDIWMRGVDGITLLREWSQSAADGVQVVMRSGHGTIETAVEATRLGAFDFVEKPLSIAKLLRTVERALEAGKRKRQPQRMVPSQMQIPAGTSRLSGPPSGGAPGSGGGGPARASASRSAWSRARCRSRQAKVASSSSCEPI